MSESIDDLVAIYHAVHYRSRRLAKRMIRQAGGRGDATTLDALLRVIADHPRRGEIAGQAEAIEAANLEAARRAKETPPDYPPWLVCETPGETSTWLVHLCPVGAHSFVARVYDGREDDGPPGDAESYAIDDGGSLGRIWWLDGRRPGGAAMERLMAEARRQLRIYDAGLGLNNPREDEP